VIVLNEKLKFKHFVDLSHLSTHKRREAAVWAFKTFGYNRVDIMNPKEDIKNKTRLIPGFWFAREQDAVFFTLRWSN
jgi:hypothetical protein